MQIFPAFILTIGSPKTMQTTWNLQHGSTKANNLLRNDHQGYSDHDLALLEVIACELLLLIESMLDTTGAL